MPCILSVLALDSDITFTSRIPPPTSLGPLTRLSSVFRSHGISEGVNWMIWALARLMFIRLASSTTHFPFHERLLLLE